MHKLKKKSQIIIVPFFSTAAYSNSIEASDFYFETQTEIIAGILPPAKYILFKNFHQMSDKDRFYSP